MNWLISKMGWKSRSVGVLALGYGALEVAGDILMALLAGGVGLFIWGLMWLWEQKNKLMS